jgi:hypothetical protein
VANLGFKKLTVDNWLQPDEASSSFARISPIDGKLFPVTGNDRLLVILEPNLEETVPFEIRKMFEVARGALAYGYFFIPYTPLLQSNFFGFWRWRFFSSARKLERQLHGVPLRKGWNIFCR